MPVARDAALRLSPLAGRGRSASAIRVRGNLREGGDDYFENASQIARHAVIPKSQDPIVSVDQPFVTYGITKAVGMLPAIDLDDQTGFAADEIYRVRPDGLLSDKFIAVQPASAQAIPQHSFRISRGAAQISGTLRFTFIGTSHAEIPPHPPRVPRVGLSPQAGRGVGHHIT